MSEISADAPISDPSGSGCAPRNGWASRTATGAKKRQLAEAFRLMAEFNASFDPVKFQGDIYAQMKKDMTKKANANG